MKVMTRTCYDLDLIWLFNFVNTTRKNSKITGYYIAHIDLNVIQLFHVVSSIIKVLVIILLASTILFCNLFKSLQSVYTISCSLMNRAIITFTIKLLDQRF